MIVDWLCDVSVHQQNAIGITAIREVTVAPSTDEAGGPCFRGSHLTEATSSCNAFGAHSFSTCRK